MRVRVTTPNVLKALRKRDPEPPSLTIFAHSPILAQPVPGCTLVAPSSKHPEEWLTRDYTEIHTGRTVKLSEKYDGHTLTPQILSNVLWRHYLHKEINRLPLMGRCVANTRVVFCSVRPIRALPPFVLIGKEIERRGQRRRNKCSRKRRTHSIWSNAKRSKLAVRS